MHYLYTCVGVWRCTTVLHFVGEGQWILVPCQPENIQVGSKRIRKKKHYNDIYVYLLLNIEFLLRINITFSLNPLLKTHWWSKANFSYQVMSSYGQCSMEKLTGDLLFDLNCSDQVGYQAEANPNPNSTPNTYTNPNPKPMPKCETENISPHLSIRT